MDRRSFRICIVDDDPAVLRLLGTALEHLGHQAILCKEGALALDRVGKEPFDLLILDLDLKSPAGMDVLCRLRRQGSEMPAILMASHCPKMTLRRWSVLHPASLLLKPFSLETLYGAILDHRPILGIRAR